jgi:ribosomal protein L37AE/L43A
VKATIVTETKTYFNCPNCGERSTSSIDHIIEYLDKPDWKQAIQDRHQYPTFGPWSCSHCGVGTRGTVYSKDNIALQITEETSVKCWDLLVLPPQKHAVYFIVDAKDYGRGGKGKSVPFEGKEYYYNEHTCPTNWIGQVERIISEHDEDPHGLFEYVESMDKDESIGDEELNWQEIFPQCFEEDKK